MVIGAPRNWYSTDSKFALELLVSYATKVERQIKLEIKNYNDNKESVLLVDDDDLRNGQMVEHYDGLDSLAWDMDAVHNLHFPNLQRKAAFITLYSFLENELEKLARKLKREIGHEGNVEDIAGNGIFRSYTYMRLIIALDIKKDATQWFRILDINKLRNIIVHAEGRLSNEDNMKKRQEDLVGRMMIHVITKDSELVLGPTFLSYVLGCFDDLFRYLDVAIQSRFPIKTRKKQ